MEFVRSPASFSSFIPGDTEPQLLINVRVLATFLSNVLNITYTLLSDAQPLCARVLSISG